MSFRDYSPTGKKTILITEDNINEYNGALHRPFKIGDTVTIFTWGLKDDKEENHGERNCDDERPRN